MKYIQIFTSCLLLLCLLAGCGGAGLPGGMSREGAGLGYTEGDFEAVVRGWYTRTEGDGYGGDPARAGETLTGREQAFAAVVQVAQTTGEPTVTVTYTEPESIAGLVVTRRGDTAEGAATITVSVYELSVQATDSRYDRLLLPATALLAQGDITAVGRDGEGRRTVTLTSSEPAALTTCSFLSGVTLPVMIRMSAEGWELDMRVSAGDGS